MTDKKLPQIQKNTSVSSVLERSKSLMTVTQKVLQKAKAAKELANVEDDSWMDRLIAWADKNNVPDLHMFWFEGDIEGGLPRDRSKLRNLTQFTVWHCPLTSLPPEIGQLSNLIELSLWNNQLTSVPPEIGQLSHLTTLYLQHNQLTSLPPEIGRLKKLRYLGLDGNPLSEIPESVFELPNLDNGSRQFLAQFKANN